MNNNEKITVNHSLIYNDAKKFLQTILGDFCLLLEHIKNNSNKVVFEANVVITPALFKRLGEHCGYSDLIFDLYSSLSSMCVGVELKEYHVLHSYLFRRVEQDQVLTYYLTVDDHITKNENEFNIIVKDWYIGKDE